MRLESELSKLRGEEGTHVRRECRAAVGPGNTDIVGLREKLAKAKADNGTLWCTLSESRLTRDWQSSSSRNWKASAFKGKPMKPQLVRFVGT